MALEEFDVLGTASLFVVKEQGRWTLNVSERATSIELSKAELLQRELACGCGGPRKPPSTDIRVPVDERAAAQIVESFVERIGGATPHVDECFPLFPAHFRNFAGDLTLQVQHEKRAGRWTLHRELRERSRGGYDVCFRGDAIAPRSDGRPDVPSWGAAFLVVEQLLALLPADERAKASTIWRC